jgi:hypothetical protein
MTHILDWPKINDYKERSSCLLAVWFRIAISLSFSCKTGLILAEIFSVVNTSQLFIGIFLKRVPAGLSNWPQTSECLKPEACTFLVFFDRTSAFLVSDIWRNIQKIDCIWDSSISYRCFDFRFKLRLNTRIILTTGLAYECGIILNWPQAFQNYFENRASHLN